MEKCMNENCPYHVKGGCDLFPGEQWKSCKRSGGSPAAGTGNKTTTTTRRKKHGK